MFIAVEFFLNIFGVVVAYWLGFGVSFIDNGNSEACWRVPVAFQILPLLFLFAICWSFPESPRYLVKVGQVDEAWFLLKRLRGSSGQQLSNAELELQDIKNIVALEKKDAKRRTYLAMLVGDQNSNLHIPRRGKSFFARQCVVADMQSSPASHMAADHAGMDWHRRCHRL